MAEYCLHCFNKMNHCELTLKDAVLSKNLEICGGCKHKRNIIVKFKNWDFLKRILK